MKWKMKFRIYFLHIFLSFSHIERARVKISTFYQKSALPLNTKTKPGRSDARGELGPPNAAPTPCS